MREKPSNIHNRGFTIAELLIVIVIISILSGLALVSFEASKGQAFRTAIINDLRNLVPTEQAYFNSNGTYTGDKNDLGFFETDKVTVVIISSDFETGWSATGTNSSIPDVTCSVAIGTEVSGGQVPGVVSC